MSIITTTMHFGSYSENALGQVVEQSIGKPFYDENIDPVGTIVNAKLVGDKCVTFEIKVEK